MNAAAAERARPERSPKPPAQIGKYVRRVGQAHGRAAEGIGHWCPGCGVMHVFADDAADLRGKQWEWHGVDAPTFSVERDITWRGFGGTVAAGRCHYAIRDGMISFFPDCTHALAGRHVPLPELPGHLRD